MKRSESQVTIKDNNEALCHLAVFAGNRSTLNFRYSILIENNTKQFNIV